MNILYEDNNILAVHKPAGLATQTSRLSEKDLYSEAKKYVNGGYIGIINRLDQPVEGIVLMAKDTKTAASLESQIAKHQMNKYYHAKIYRDGSFDNTIKITDDLSCFPISLTCFLKKGKDNTSVICNKNENDAKEAKLEFAFREVNEKDALLDIHLLTGRHHQIRVQLSSSGMPILGDRKYGSEASIAYSNEMGIKYIALCAYKLEFTHPLTNKRIVVEINK